jgi:ribosomal protein S3AE
MLHFENIRRSHQKSAQSKIVETIKEESVEQSLSQSNSTLIVGAVARNIPNASQNSQNMTGGRTLALN